MPGAYVEDTIAAIATARGPGAISVLRLSGRDALAVAGRMLRARHRDDPLQPQALESHRTRLARLVSPLNGRTIDEVMVLPMRAPKSFTGEDVVEIHCHGGRLISAMAMRTALECGARAAMAGEFTERAFLNGRLDLCQAEAVADLIEARSEAGLAAAWCQLEGGLSERIGAERDRILDARALAEAHLDFPEDDLPPGVERELVSLIASSREQLDSLARTFDRGRLAREGIRVVLVGKPNVGKSSLMNALLGRDRALVSDEPGTTRDYLEEPLAIGSLEILLSDTAGIRNGRDAIERAGIARSQERIESADVLVLLLDGTREIDDEDLAIFRRTDGRPTVVARTKIDLPAVWATDWLRSAWSLTTPCIDVSAKTGAELERLCEAIVASVPSSETSEDEILITRSRHHAALAHACGHLDAARALLANDEALELVACELQSATSELDALVGATTVEDVLDRVFRQFCVGK